MGTQAVTQASKDNESSQKQRHKNTLLDETLRVDDPSMTDDGGYHTDTDVISNTTY